MLLPQCSISPLSRTRWLTPSTPWPAIPTSRRRWRPPLLPSLETRPIQETLLIPTTAIITAALLPAAMAMTKSTVEVFLRLESRTDIHIIYIYVRSLLALDNVFFSFVIYFDLVHFRFCSFLSGFFLGLYLLVFIFNSFLGLIM